MEPPLASADSDEREEGEIVDDDFEDISDNSIIVPSRTGKCVSSKGHLRGLSLSSISDGETPAKERHRRKSETKKRQKLVKRRRSSRRRSTHSISDDSDTAPERKKKFQKLLKAAISVEKEEIHQNSLETRLKLMKNLDIELESNILPNEVPSTGVEESEVKSDIEDNKIELDNELILLRAEALKTAVYNKFKLRKKRKLKEIKNEDVLSDTSLKSDISETNKENNIIKNICKNIIPEIEKDIAVNPEHNVSQEEDEDVLRALLLASMSKKITEDQGRNLSKEKAVAKSVSVNNTKTINNHKAIGQKISLSNGIHKLKAVNKPVIKTPLVKPLIINVNGDSDTDDEVIILKDTQPNNKKKVESAISTDDIQNTVDKFLKEQRAQVEAKHLALNSTPILKNKVSNNLPIKSAVKLLPKDKQIEYQKLVQRLAIAKSKPVVRKKIIDTKNVVLKTPKSKVPPAIQKNEKTPEFRKEIVNFRQVYKDIQTQNNGRKSDKFLQQSIKQRLQIQEKYTPLKPIVTKIFEMSNEKKKHEKRVKELIQELNFTKKKLEQSQQMFCSQVQELISKKQNIDQSLSNKKLPPKKIVKTNLVKNLASSESIQNHITPINGVKIQTESKTIEVNNQKRPDSPINYGDPNDIDKILKIPIPMEHSSIAKYISPLGSKRNESIDPLGILCPYDVDGNCRDKDCAFKHIL